MKSRIEDTKCPSCKQVGGVLLVEYSELGCLSCYKCGYIGQISSSPEDIVASWEGRPPHSKWKKFWDKVLRR
ncbi:MAG: hypothetical protein KAS32_17640 [Candidatus Peribacteraceae bacterium]|nr:hypothetical protein [Candidatus Peribacteraceae bacterium]